MIHWDSLVRAVALTLCVGGMSLGQHADATRSSDDIFATATDAGTTLGVLSSDQVKALVNRSPLVAVKGPWYEIGVASVCGGRPGDPDHGNACGRFNTACRFGGGEGPPVAVWVRQVDRHGRPTGSGDWIKRGDTCYPELIPRGRQLTMAMIRAAFRETDFSVPTLNIQPEGDVTLVNLPTYFEVRFSAAGFGPDEVDTPDPSLLLGHTIEIRPRLTSVTYHLGETTVGPTTSLGGPHPTGDVRATYTRPGTHEVRADIVYTGQFRIGGSGWVDIPGQVALTGTPVTITVREAKARLYTTP